MRDLVQGSDAWHEIRLGRATASRIHDIIAKTKSGYSASRARYEAELIAERLTGQPAASFTSAAMQHGIDTEPQARAAYEFLHDTEVEQVGFVAHPSVEHSGASPDGLVGDDGMVEIKCPETHTHLAYLLGGAIDARYRTQMLWQMACTGRDWCDWVSFDPRLPVRHQLIVRRVERDDERIAEIEAEVREFLDGIAEKIARLEAME